MARKGLFQSVAEFMRVIFLDHLRDFKKLSKLIDVADFALPIKAWNATRNVIGSILLASLLINLLSLAFPMALLQIYDRIIPNVAMNTLALLVIGVGVALILEASLRIGRAYVGAWADAKFEHITRCQAFKAVVDSSMLEFEKEGSGKHLKRLNAINILRDFYSGQAVIAIIDLPFIFILLALIYYIAGYLVFVPIVMLLVFLYFAFRNAGQLKVVLSKRQDEDERRSNFIIETLSNIHTVKSNTMEAQMQRRYERLQRTSAGNDFNVGLRSSQIAGTGMSLSQLTIVAVVAFGSIFVMRGDLTIGGLAACTLLSGRCLQPVNMIVSLWSRLQSIKIARKDLETTLSLKQESEPDLPNLESFKGGVEFQNVSFRYSEDTDWVLKNINLKINPGDVISVTGPGFGGKSTLIWLLMGMLKPDDGKILLDGQDASKFNAASYRKKIAYLPQQSVLFNGTIIENLTVFDEKEHYSKAIAAANVVGLSDVIEHLPNGYHTQVAHQAIDTLARGINQRIVIARALVFKPGLVIFDEANTAMDMQSDAVVKKMLKKIVGKCSMIIISHRPSILTLAKKHYVLEHAQLREMVQ